MLYKARAGASWRGGARSMSPVAAGMNVNASCDAFVHSMMNVIKMSLCANVQSRLGIISELIDWLKLLMADDIPEEILTNRDTTKAIPPLYGALVKNEQDVQLLERLAFMNRRQSNTNSPGQ